MSYNLSEITYPSTDGIHTIYAEIYTPKHCAAKGIVQLAHGMVDYVGRYEELAERLTEAGYIFAGNHHLGHGKSVNSEEDYGFFAERDGVIFVLRDMHTLNRRLRNDYPSLPLVIFGHSMGSFLSRLYVERYPHTIKAAVIHGTAGPNGAASMGRALARLIGKIKGSHHRSKLIDKLAFGSYNSHFDKSEGSNAWLTRDISAVAGRDSDPYTNFKFTVSGFSDLFWMLRESNGKGWFENYPQNLPTLIMSGDDDPVGNYGKGPEYVYKHLMLAGCDKITIKSYEGARHELFKETNKEEVFDDLILWLDAATGTTPT